VARGEDEAVAVGPIRCGGVVTEVPAPENESEIGGAHGQSGVAGLRLLDRIDGEEANGIDGCLRKLGIGWT